jgi:hypothetical protein
VCSKLQAPAALFRRLGGPQSRSRRSEVEKKILAPARNRTPDTQPLAHHKKIRFSGSRVGTCGQMDGHDANTSILQLSIANVLKADKLLGVRTNM